MRILVTRMSSLGDILLSTAFLENLPPNIEVDWIISSEFAFVLKNHPRIRKLHVFDKKSGLEGWLRLIWELSREQYDRRVDLHRTLRSRLANTLFKLSDLIRRRWVPHLHVSKQRMRTWVLLLLKGHAFKPMLPEPYWLRFAKVGASLNGEGSWATLKGPSFLPPLNSISESENEILERYSLKAKDYVAVMPSSRWRGKEWGTDRFVEVMSALSAKGIKVLVLGRNTDRACTELLTLLQNKGLAATSALEEPDFRVTAVLIRNSRYFLGTDTGLSHLAEAVGVPAFVIFGPTRPELGFGPRGPQSKAISKAITCAPCSKDGKTCLRVTEPYACMNRLSANDVLKELPQ